MKVNTGILYLQFLLSIYMLSVVVAHAGLIPLPNFTIKDIWMAANIGLAGFAFMWVESLREKNE